MQQQVTHVLVVDDNDSDIEVVQRYLKRSPHHRFQTHTANSIEEGIEQARRQPVDAILLDLSLTDSHGIDTLRELLSANITAAVIVLTGHDEERTALDAIHAGAQDYLVKDKFTAQLLIRTIRYAVERATSIQLLKIREQELLRATTRLEQEIERRSLTEKALEDAVLNRTQALNVQVAWRKRAEEELEHTEKDLQYQTADLEIIFKALPDAIVFADNSRRIRKVSAAITNLFGYAPDELLGKSTQMLYADDRQAQAQGKDRFNPSAQETLAPYDMTYRRQDGSVFTGETIGTVVRDDNGQPLGFVGIIRDVTQQRQLRQERDNAQAELACRQLQLQQFVKHIPATVAMFDTQMRYLFYSDRWLTDYGIDAEDITGQNHYDVFPEIPPAWKKDHQICLSGSVLQSNEDTFVRQDGKTDWLKWELRPWYEPSGEVGGILMLTEVITAQKNAQLRLQESLQESEARFRTFMDHSFAVTFMKDAAGRYLYTNWKFEQMSGLSQAHILGKTDGDWLPSAVAQRLCQHDSTVLETGEASQSSEEILMGDGRLSHWIMCKFPCPTDDGRIALGGIAVDITEQKRTEQELAWQASHDELTGLKNRRYFELTLDRILRQPHRNHILCFLDLDQFKIVNDTCGHSAGDELLKQISSILTQNVRSTDTVARLGGDEFGILIGQCSLETARNAMDLIRQVIQDFRFVWEDNTFGIGVSIGAVELTDSVTSLADALGAADIACYAAKDRGRNRLCVYRADDQELSKQRSQQQWISRIQQALDNHEFQLYQQPIAPAAGGSRDAHHREILLRLTDSLGQLIPPMAFMPAAERYGLMPAIDRWVVQTFFEQMERPSPLSPQLGSNAQSGFYAINLSGASINDEQFLPFLIQQVKQSTVRPESLCFEITETVAVSNLNLARTFIGELKALGCSFALDDFGSGMSSFGYLRHLAVDYIKIDGSFVRNLLQDNINTSIVEAITKIAHSMGLEAIAEHVENEATQRKLQQLGVDYVQGYGIGKPVPLQPTVTALLSA